MGTHGDNVFVIFGFAAGSFLLALLALFGMLGVFLLGFVLIPLLPVVAIVAAIVLALKGSPVPAAAKESAAVEVEVAPVSALETAERLVADTVAALEAAEPPAVETQAPVVAAVVEASGVCPVGRSYDVGATWTLNGKWSGGALCPLVERGLSHTAEQIRHGEALDGELWRCVGKEHRVLFQLRKAPKAEAASSA